MLAVALLGCGHTIGESETFASHPEQHVAEQRDVFVLDEPGRYVAVALAEETSGDGPDAELPVAVLDTRHARRMVPATASGLTTVDHLAGARYGVVPPTIFQVNGEVEIHVRPQGAAYRLVIVRLGAQADDGDVAVHPPVASIADANGSVFGALDRRFRIMTDAVHWDPTGRQTFVVAPSQPFLSVARS